MTWLRQYVRDLRDGCAVLTTRRFWSAFKAFYSPSSIADRLDEHTAKIRRARGLPPDPRVERRRAKRRT